MWSALIFFFDRLYIYEHDDILVKYARQESMEFGHILEYGMMSVDSKIDFTQTLIHLD